MPNEHTIAENLQRLVDAKDDIAAAITAKGGTVAQGDGLEEFPIAINGISTGVDTSNDTVTAATLKSGYTAHNAAGQPITGTMLSQPTTVTAETLADGITAYNAAGELITGTIHISSWVQLQAKVRTNNMSDISIGDQYTCSQGSGELTWDVIGKDIDTPANPNLSHALTLRVHSLLPKSLKFDEPEAFYACQSSALSAGTYYYNSGGTNYQFTLTQSVPVGGQLVCKSESRGLKSYASGSSTTPIETVSLTIGSSGTNLGTLVKNTRSGNLNTDYRRQSGSNDWKESAIRQWLNSNKPAGQWWEPQNPWDRPPAYAETMNGFMYDLDPEFLDVISKTQVTTNYFDTSTGAVNGTYTTEDYFFLMSASQVNSNYSGEGTKYTPYSNDASRKMYKNGSASDYWLRSPSTSSSVRYVYSSGYMGFTDVDNDYGVAPACNII